MQRLLVKGSMRAKNLWNSPSAMNETDLRVFFMGVHFMCYALQKILNIFGMIPTLPLFMAFILLRMTV